MNVNAVESQTANTLRQGRRATFRPKAIYRSRASLMRLSTLRRALMRHTSTQIGIEPQRIRRGLRAVRFLDERQIARSIAAPTRQGSRLLADRCSNCHWHVDSVG